MSAPDEEKQLGNIQTMEVGVVYYIEQEAT